MPSAELAIGSRATIRSVVGRVRWCKYSRSWAMARERWLMAFFVAGPSSAKVRWWPAGAKIGSSPKPLAPCAVWTMWPPTVLEW